MKKHQINIVIILLFALHNRVFAQDKIVDNQRVPKRENYEINYLGNMTIGEFNDIYKDDPKNTQILENELSPFLAKTPTPSRLFTSDLSMPDTFSTTNNLAKKAGSFYRAYGEIVYIQGTVTDSFGVPIHNAVIEIWQTNSAGKYHTLLESGSGYVDKFFSMSGRAISDNLGNYHFITIMPGATSGRAPHVNFNIYHPRFGKLETEMYFVNHPYNFSDYQYLAYNDEERKLLTADIRNTDILNPNSIKLATFNITLKGVHQYKKF
jgi:protocatechuate 3,4-dioxygenase, beta subunit